MRTIFHTDVSPKILIREDTDKDSFLISTPAYPFPQYFTPTLIYTFNIGTKTVLPQCQVVSVSKTTTDVTETLWMVQLRIITTC